MVLLMAAVFGLCIGSFFNVVIYRLPRGESLNHPPSHCPACGVAVRPYDNVPVISWIALRGRCRSCSVPISSRYPAVELLTAAAAAGVAISKHGAHDLALGFILVAAAVPAGFIDFDVRKIPNQITASAAAGAIIAGLITRPAGLPTQLLWGAVAGGFLLIFALLYPGGLGMGDVKLAGVIGLCLGNAVVVGLIAGLLLAALVGIGVIVRVGAAQGRKTAIPLGPFLAAGALIGLYAGHPIVHWYLNHVV